jgi:hypothetical protein
MYCDDRNSSMRWARTFASSLSQPPVPVQASPPHGQRVGARSMQKRATEPAPWACSFSTWAFWRAPRAAGASITPAHPWQWIGRPFRLQIGADRRHLFRQAAILGARGGSKAAFEERVALADASCMQPAEIWNSCYTNLRPSNTLRARVRILYMP